MVKRDWSLCVFSAAMAFLLSVTGVACLLTAFDAQCNIGTVLFCCMAASIVWSVSFTLRKAWIPMAAYALVIGYVWRSGALGASIACFTAGEGPVDCVLCVVAAAGCLNTAFAVCRRQHGILCIIFAAAPLIPCFFSESAVPSPLWLGIWLFGMTLLLLTQPARRQGGGKAHTTALFLPVAVLCVALLLLLPQNKQEKPRQLANWVVQYLQEKGIGVPAGRALKVDGGAVELRKLGPRQEAEYPVMTVTSDRGGVLYLRGCAYDTYFQNNWTNLNLREDLYWPEDLKPAGKVTVKTEYTMSMRYFPYYAEELASVSRGINNFSKQTEYTYEVSVLRAQPDSHTSMPEHGYCQLPTVTQRWAESVLEELITAGMTDGQKITAITDYVKRLAKYSLYAEAMPSEEADFVVWFAREADRGYCVHFASAAAALLRAAGIPTRFATGYMVQTKPGEETVVYGKDAHAWAECFLEGIGWVPVEATPGAEPEVSAQQQETTESIQLPVLPVLYGGAVLMAGLTAFMYIRWAVAVLKLRRKRKKGADRERIFHLYSQLAQLLALNGTAPPRELERIAEKARFSNQPVDPDSFEKLEKELKSAKKALKKHGIFRKIQYRLIWNLY